MERSSNNSDQNLRSGDANSADLPHLEVLYPRVLSTPFYIAICGSPTQSIEISRGTFPAGATPCTTIPPWETRREHHFLFYALLVLFPGTNEQQRRLQEMINPLQPRTWERSCHRQKHGPRLLWTTTWLVVTLIGAQPDPPFAVAGWLYA
ncbi:uncharacterized protein B0I36DRAFT_396595 [Microdochium trichocladiopsis]|uniref:Uncharacterized protein n=1 Tax=Microdochium trichocladiopsis TaxID=1682393 RepID=A0A9P9BJ42_9PEZI|nr:uncharacterized protein B0I36DRAFT_396595 [Microdochium trichocladiopsis]KAH7016343.1 hypothetical protein B0I36DRAFT_396595 [Microdochium trichocladiopsis]